jgi:HEAT repeat protein
MTEDGDLLGKRPREEFRLTLDSDLQETSPPGQDAPDETIERFIDLIRNEQFSIRIAATRKLISIGRKAVPALLKVLQNGLWYTRECAARALGDIGDVRAIEPLVVRLGDENVGVRKAAANAIAGIVDKDGLAEVAEAIAQLPEDRRGIVLEFIRKASQLAGRRLDEILGVHGEPHKKMEEMGGEGASLFEKANYAGPLNDGMRRLWNRLRRLFETGS